MRVPVAVLMTALFFSGPVCAEETALGAEAASWPVKQTSHFTIYHEKAMAPQAIAMTLEKLYSKLRMHMSAFAPWMVTKKTKVYVYATQQSYQRSSFNPPPWSEALALPQSYAIMVYDSDDSESLERVLMHELTHLFFGSFFRTKPDALPIWLDEGMATNMEDIVHGQRGDALKRTKASSFVPFPMFVKESPTQSSSTQAVGRWYLQAYGTVKFMYGSRNKLQFTTYCKKLLAGSSPERALWEAYKIGSWKLFDTRWRSWLENEQSESDNSTVGGTGSFLKSSNSSFKSFRSN